MNTMRALLLPAVSCLAIVVAIGCSDSKSRSGFSNGTGNGTGDDGGATGDDDGVLSGDGGFTSGDGGTTGQNCSEAAKLVYVLSSDNDLYSFSPPSKSFTKIGRLACQTAMTPNSMAVDRDAIAWVNYVEEDPNTGKDTGGNLFKVSTANASCQPTSIQLPTNWYRVGMGFSTDTATGTAETLYVAAIGSVGGSKSPGLGKIDLGAQKLNTIGPFTGALLGQSAELTGTGDARLFGFFTTMPVQVAELNKASGAVTSTKALAGVETPAFWAFSFWGGDFYFYTAPDARLKPSRTSNVTRYRPSDGSIDTTYMTNIGFRIVGAGVSTCAPTTPPR
jgi:hypothetical protein